MAWWIWVLGGLAIGALELLLPGYMFLGFAVGALAAAAASWLGLLAGFPAQLALAAVVSLVVWAGLRAAFPLQRGEVKRFTRDIND
ncbi:MAG TPA: hypothetical protein PLH11_10200 [Gemmobacter sp.]|nr:hypothetical protein [Gemmobacter sp.]